MFTIGNKRTPKHVLRLTALMLVFLLLVSCGSGNPSGGGKPVDSAKPDSTMQPDATKTQSNDQEEPDTNAPGPGATSTVAESFGAYVEAKGELLTALTDALTNNPGTELDSLSLLGVMMVDMVLLPAASFGLGNESAAATLGILGAGDIEYSENGNEYSIKYKNDDGEKHEIIGVFDPKTNGLKCIAIKDGKENVVSEYKQTPYGYVSQIYFVNDDGEASVYQMTISGKSGIVGISEASSVPAALSGNEAIDFPKTSKEWYALDGDEFTGVNSEGEKLSFKYTPSDD
jgi:hypothetical protein